MPLATGSSFVSRHAPRLREPSRRRTAVAQKRSNLPIPTLAKDRAPRRSTIAEFAQARFQIEFFASRRGRVRRRGGGPRGSVDSSMDEPGGTPGSGWTSLDLSGVAGTPAAPARRRVRSAGPRRRGAARREARERPADEPGEPAARRRGRELELEREPGRERPREVEPAAPARRRAPRGDALERGAPHDALGRRIGAPRRARRDASPRSNSAAGTRSRPSSGVSTASEPGRRGARAARRGRARRDARWAPRIMWGRTRRRRRRRRPLRATPPSPSPDRSNRPRRNANPRASPARRPRPIARPPRSPRR